jgi:hypothetical protein
MASRRTKGAVSKLPLLLLLGFLNGLLGGCSKRGQIDNQVSIASPCILVSQPSEHSGQKINLTGYITSTKEGAYMWGDGCKTSGVVLHMGSALIQDTKFQDALLNYGLSPSPIKATLLGLFQYSRVTGVKTFNAEQVLDLQINPRTEARPEVQPAPSSSRDH